MAKSWPGPSFRNITGMRNKEESRRRAGDAARRYADILADIAGVNIFERSRERKVSWCRFMAMWQLLRDGYTSLLVGEVFGLDHSSVLSARDAIDAMRIAPHQYPELSPVFQEFKKKMEK